MLEMQARDIKYLKQLVQQLGEKVQENNETILQNKNNHRLLNISVSNKSGKLNLIPLHRVIFTRNADEENKSTFFLILFLKYKFKGGSN